MHLYGLNSFYNDNCSKKLKEKERKKGKEKKKNRGPDKNLTRDFSLHIATSQTRPRRLGPRLVFAKSFYLNKTDLIITVNTSKACKICSKKPLMRTWKHLLKKRWVIDLIITILINCIWKYCRGNSTTLPNRGNKLRKRALPVAVSIYSFSVSPRGLRFSP